MIRSMTGFGRAVFDVDGVEFEIEIRSVAEPLEIERSAAVALGLLAPGVDHQLLGPRDPFFDDVAHRPDLDAVDPEEVLDVGGPLQTDSDKADPNRSHGLIVEVEHGRFGRGACRCRPRNRAEHQAPGPEGAQSDELTTVQSAHRGGTGEVGALRHAVLPQPS